MKLVKHNRISLKTFITLKIGDIIDIDTQRREDFEELGEGFFEIVEFKVEESCIRAKEIYEVCKYCNGLVQFKNLDRLWCLGDTEYGFLSNIVGNIVLKTIFDDILEDI